MFLHTPSMRPREKHQYQDDLLARAFWDSYWGQEAAAGEGDTAVLVITFLTSGKAAGGMEASWDSCCGLQGLLRAVNETRPEGAPPCASQP